MRAEITGIRYYKAANGIGTHVGRIWSSTGTPLASVTFSGETASGWQQQALSAPISINSGTSYTVSVNANSYYAFTSQGFSSAITNGPLTAGIGAGVYNETPGQVPTLVYQNELQGRRVRAHAGDAEHAGRSGCQRHYHPESG